MIKGVPWCVMRETSRCDDECCNVDYITQQNWAYAHGVKVMQEWLIGDQREILVKTQSKFSYL